MLEYKNNFTFKMYDHMAWNINCMIYPWAET
jgi:hypothetical protein